jgi:hypothetical protein
LQDDRAADFTIGLDRCLQSSFHLFFLPPGIIFPPGPGFEGIVSLFPCGKAFLAVLSWHLFFAIEIIELKTY